MAKTLEQLIKEANYWRAKEGLPPLTAPDETQRETEGEYMAEHSYAYKRLLDWAKKQEAAEQSATTEPTSSLENATESEHFDVTIPEQDLTEKETETQQETTPLVEETVSDYQNHLICGTIGFLLGILVAFLYFRIRIKKIKAECEARINEARASLDKMISMITKK